MKLFNYFKGNLLSTQYSVKPLNLLIYINSDKFHTKKESLKLHFHSKRYGIYYSLFLTFFILLIYTVLHFFHLIHNATFLHNPHNLIIISITFTVSIIFSYIYIKKILIKSVLEEEFIRIWNLRFPLFDYIKHEKQIKEVVSSIMKDYEEGKIKASLIEKEVNTRLLEQY